MTETVTLKLPAALVERARTVAERTQRRFEDVLIEWMNRAEESLPVEDLGDEEILALCDSQLPAAEQDELGQLLTRQREGVLSAEEKPRLDELLHSYRRGMVRKAQALRTAVARGLRPPLGET